VVAERYPELKANQNFQALQAQLEGTENRISVERGNFNQAVRDYNTAVRSFPTVLFAGLMGFHAKPFFNAQPGAERPPTVNFNLKLPPRRRLRPLPPRRPLLSHPERSERSREWSFQQHGLGGARSAATCQIPWNHREAIAPNGLG
jgi:LemA protein